MRSTLDSPSNTTEAHLPNEIAYADDIDFIGNQPVNVKKIEETLKVHKLKVNVDKTEHTSVRKHSEEWKTSKKVGSLLGSKEDIEHRKHLSNIALNRMEQIWHRADKTKQRTRIKLYNTLVRSVLLYNCGTWALTKTDEEKLDSFHRKQLRRVLGIRYPTKFQISPSTKKVNKPQFLWKCCKQGGGCSVMYLGENHRSLPTKLWHSISTTMPSEPEVGRSPHSQ